MKIIYDVNVPYGKVNRTTGEIYINPNLPSNIQRFILAHEMGHLHLDTSNEFAADSYAIQQTAGKFPSSLRTAAKSLLMLNPNNPEHKKRIEKGLQQIAIIDFQRYNNTKSAIMVLTKQQNDVLFKILVKFLKEKNIKSIKELSEEARQKLMIEFFKQPAVSYFLQKVSNVGFDSYDDYEGQKQKGKFWDKVGNFLEKSAPVVGGAVTAVGLAFGVPIPPQVGSKITDAIGEGFQKLGNEKGKKANPQYTAQQNQLQQQQSKPKESEPAITYAPQQKNTNLFIILAIAGVIILGLYFLNRR